MLIKLFVSFFLVMIISVLIIGLTSDINFSKSLEEQIGLNKTLQLDHIVKQIDLLIEGTDKKNIQFISDYEYRSDYYKGPLHENKSREEIFSLLNIIKALENMEQSDNAIHSAYLYNKKYNYVICSDSTLSDADEFYDNFFINMKNNVTYYFSLTPSRFLGRKPGESASANSEKVISIIRTMPINVPDWRSMLIINIREKEIFNIIKDLYTGNDECVYVINNKNEVISSKKDSKKDFSSEEEYIKNLDKNVSEAYYKEKIGRTDYLINCKISEYTGWRFVTLYPIAKIRKDINQIRAYMFSIMLLLILMGICISYLISKRLYKPVNSILATFRKSADCSMLERSDEFSFINDAINKIIEDGKNVEKYLENSKYLIKRNYVNLLLKGGADPEKINEIENFIGADQPYRNFVVFVLSLENYPEDISSFGEDERYSLRMLLISTCEEISGKYGFGTAANLNNARIALIINLKSVPENEQDNKAKLKEIAEEMKSTLEKYMNISVTIGAGRVYYDHSTIHKSYKEALDALGYGKFENKDSIFMFDDIKDCLQYDYPYQNEIVLINNIKAGDENKIEGILKELCDELQYNQNISLSYGIYILKTMRNEIIKTAIYEGVPMEYINGKNENFANEIIDSDSYEQAMELLMESCLNIAKYYMDMKENKDSNYIHKILNYIHMNYDKELSISETADQFGISYSYVRKLFDDQVKCSFPHYLHNIRIRYARELLEKTDMQIKDIGLKVGYNNIHTFNRIFKKMVGVTQGEYRSNAKGA